MKELKVEWEVLLRSVVDQFVCVSAAKPGDWGLYLCTCLCWHSCSICKTRWWRASVVYLCYVCIFQVKNQVSKGTGSQRLQLYTYVSVFTFQLRNQLIKGFSCVPLCVVCVCFSWGTRWLKATGPRCRSPTLCSCPLTRYAVPLISFWRPLGGPWPSHMAPTVAHLSCQGLKERTCLVFKGCLYGVIPGINGHCSQCLWKFVSIILGHCCWVRCLRGFCTEYLWALVQSSG